ncbi:MAG: leucine-rich repeat domain-containing protein, partial [Planctomycetaceae bacterium]|nr:leucine-rich repeat domain-containing protein [Planctomycetaceae bacterium]
MKKETLRRNRSLQIEMLESREMLSVNPLLPLDDQQSDIAIVTSAPQFQSAESVAPEVQASIPSNANAADAAWLDNFLATHTNLTDSIATWSNGRITSLNLSNKGLTGTLDVSGLAALNRLDCYNNQLTSLDVSGLTALTRLDCSGNQLTALGVSKNTALTALVCHSNQLASLDVSKNTALTELWCDTNQLTSLDLNIALNTLSCSANRLTSLDLSKNTALTKLWFYNNQLTSLDVSKNT